MGFPVAAYRTNGNTERRTGGRGGYQKPPTPANDNVRLPKPANDNWRPFPKPKPPIGRPFGRRLPPGALAVARRSTPLLKLATRGVPLVGTALLLYDLYELSQTFPRAMPGTYNMYGWTLTRDCGVPGRAYTGQLTNCGQVIGHFQSGPYGIPPPKSGNIINFMKPRFIQNVYKWWTFLPSQSFERTAASLPGLQRYVVPSVRPEARPVREPEWVPAVDPFVVPPWSDPLPTPSPLPRGVAPPATAAEGDWSQRGYEFNPAPSARPKPYHRHRRPPPREKEKKSRVRQGFAIALKGGYAATEMKDAVEALTDGVWTPFGKLPPAFPQWVLDKLPKDATVFDKMKLAVRYWGELDPTQAVVNLGANQVIDVAVGVPQGKLTDFANQHGFTHGPLAFDGLKI